MNEFYEIENQRSREITYRTEIRELIFEALASWYHQKFTMKVKGIRLKRKQMYSHQIISFYCDGYIYRFRVNAHF